VGAAAVVDRLDPRGETRLVAYVTSANLQAADLRAFVGEHVPTYMVPSAFVALAELPLTPNGKVDRDALPEPTWERSETVTAVEPRTDTERRMVAIWAEVLGVEQVGVSDNFFELGGHSLMAVRLFSEIESAFGVRVPLSALFETATVAELAAALDASRGGEQQWSSSVVKLQGGDERAPLWLLPWADGEVLPYRDLIENLDTDRAVYGLLAPGVDRREVPLSTVEGLATHFVKTVREMQPHGPYALGGYCFSGLVAYEMARELISDGESVSLLAMLDSFPWRESVRPTRMEIERVKWQKLMDADLRGKRAWVRRRVHGLLSRPRNLLYNSKGVSVLDWLEARNLQRLMPRWPWNLVIIASNLARRRYRPSPLDVRIEFFQAVTSPDWGPTPWEPFAGRGVEVRQVVAPDIDHRLMMLEPHVRIVADQLSALLESEALDRAG
jgi:thioesterase domain-containing protein/acyl carrier protein